MFKGTLNDSAILKNSIDPITELIDEAVLQIKNDGLKLISADRAVVVVVDFFLKKEEFQEYEIEQEMEIGLNLPNFLQVLKRAGNNEKMELKTDGSTLNITINGTSKRNFQIPIMNISSDETPDTSKLEFKNQIQMNASELKNAVDDADLITDSIVFVLNENSLKMSSSSDANAVEIEIPKENLNKFEFSENCKARFSLEYLKKILKASKISDVVDIKMSNDYPMNIVFEDKNVKIGFILAPRVED